VQEQEELPAEFVQTWAHPPLLVAHSLTSAQVLLFALRTYPALQEQASEPTVLLQICEQPPLLDAHSLMSLQVNRSEVIE